VQQSAKGKEKSDGDQHGSIRKFLRLNPPAFHGSANPLEAEDWLTEIEKILMPCTVQGGEGFIGRFFFNIAIFSAFLKIILYFMNFLIYCIVQFSGHDKT
jgi:hypothetical protein